MSLRDRHASCAVVLVALSAASITTDASAAPHAASDAPSVKLSIAPMFGADAATDNGWSDLVARVENVGTAPAKGELDLTVSQGYSADDQLATRASFAVPAGRTSVVVLPLHPFSPWYAPQATLTATSDTGVKLGSATVAIDNTVAPLLVEIAEPARLVVAMRGWPASTTWSPNPAALSTPVTISVGAPPIDRTTGDPILPDRGVGYAPVTAVVARSDRLARLDEPHQRALIDWVAGGGTVAVAVTRPEDLRAPLIETLVGGEARRASAPARLLSLPAYEKPDAPDATSPAPSGSPPAERRPVREGPSAPLAAKLTGYAGAALAASDYGASAPFGLGEAHLLAFDPSGPEALADPWAQTRIAELVGRAWDRRSRVALPAGAGERTTSRIDVVRRALDPNENYRLGLGVSTLLLLVYAVVVGPLVFARAAKRGAPLLPLRWIPVWSGIAFFAIVAVGMGVKGWRGRARHLTLLESGSGATRAASRGYRGFFASDARTLTVSARDATSLLAVGSVESMTRAGPGVLTLDAAEATLTDLGSLPWQTVVVREDGFADVGGGVTLGGRDGTGVTVTNHTGRVLKDCVVRAPRGAAAYFATIDDGQTVTLAQGRSVSIPTSSSYGARSHDLSIEAIGGALAAREGARLTGTWSPVEAAAGNMVDWWPNDAIALIGEIAGSSRPGARDAGLVLESDRTLIHVVGEVAP